MRQVRAMDLRSARTKRGWTLEYVADLLGTSAMSVSRHETGAAHPRPVTVDRYLAIYGGDVTEADIRESCRRFQRSAGKRKSAKEAQNV